MKNLDKIPKVLKVEKGRIKVGSGDCYLYSFMISADEVANIHYAFTSGLEQEALGRVIPCRINSACITSEVFGCEKCDCKWQLDEAIKYICENKLGIITYHPTHEGLGHGIFAKLKSFNLVEELNTTYVDLGCEKEDIRDFSPVLSILNYFDINNVILLGNNLNKKYFLENSGINVEYMENLIYTGENKTIEKYILNKGNLLEHRVLKRNKNNGNIFSNR